MTTYYLTNTTASPTPPLLNGADFDDQIATTVGTQAELTITVSNAGGAETSYWWLQNPPSIADGSGTYSVEINVLTATADVNITNVRFARYNSAGVLQSESPIPAGLPLNISATGVTTFSATWSTTWNTGDWLRIQLSYDGLPAHGNTSFGIGVNGANAEVVVPTGAQSGSGDATLSWGQTNTATGSNPAGFALWDFVKVTESYVSGDANQTSCSLTQATHGSTAGNLLVGAVSIDKDSGTITPPTGWTEINAVMQNTSFGVSTWVGWRVATGDSNDDFAMSWATAVGNSDTHVGEWYTQGITPVLEDDGYVWPDAISTGHTVDLGAAAAAGRLIAWACVDSDKLSFSYTGVTEHANQISTHLSGFGQSVGTFGSTTVAASDPRSVTSLWSASDENYLVTMQFVESVAVTFVAATEMATIAASTVHALTLPTYQADDIIVVSAAWNGSPSSVTDDLGFTDVFADQWGTNNNPRSSLMWKRMTGSEGATITLTTGNSITAGVSAQCFRGVDTTTALDAAAANFSGLSGDDLFDVPSVTPVTAGAMHVVGAANNTSTQTFDPPTGYTEDADTNLLGAGRANTAAHKLLGAAAATGVITFARAGGGTTFDYNTWSLVLRPAGGAPTPSGDASASWGFTGTATGAKTASGTASQSWGFTGTATGSGPASPAQPTNSSHVHTADAAIVTATAQVAPADALHSHAADQAIVTATAQVAPASALHAHAADAASVTATAQITPADGQHANTTDQATVTAPSLIVPANALHAHAGDQAQVTAVANVQPVDGAHVHTADQALLTSSVTASPNDALHAHAAEAPIVSTGLSTSPVSTTHAHTADEALVTATAQVVPASAQHAHAADQASVVAAATISPADALHGHTADATALLATAISSPADALHDHVTDQALLATTSSITPNDAIHAHTGDAAVVTATAQVAPADSSHGHVADAAVVTTTTTVSPDEAWHDHLADPAPVLVPGLCVPSSCRHLHFADQATVSGVLETSQNNTHGRREIRRHDRVRERTTVR